MSKMDGIGDYFLSIIVMALGPAIFEETFFRGALQNILHKWSGRKWMPLIITSLVFSAIHFSYYGFIPRMALGIILGLLYLRSGSLWMPILAHFINNALVVTVIFYLTSQGRPIEDAMEETDPLWVGAIALVAIVCLFMYYKKFSEDVKKRKMPVEDRALEEQWLA
jgi:membrane protease YdiL (CAAX protease family)